MDEARGVGMFSVNLGWRDLPIRDAVGSLLGVPTVVGHDVRAGLLAETRLGAARGARHALFLPVGTGIAGALLLDGTVISAEQGTCDSDRKSTRLNSSHTMTSRMPSSA